MLAGRLGYIWANWSNGKARVCKILSSQFKSGVRLQLIEMVVVERLPDPDGIMTEYPSHSLTVKNTVNKLF